MQIILLVLSAFAGGESYGQCSLGISNYSNNVALPTQISVSGTPSTQYTWQFGDASADTVTGTPVVSHLFTDTGTYTVCVYGFDSNALCYDTVCQALNLFCSISGSITANTDSSGITYFIANVQASGNITGYNWIITTESGGEVYNNTSLFDTLNLTLGNGAYMANTIVSTGTGCTDTIGPDTITIGGPVHCNLLQPGTPQSKDTYIRSDIPNINFGLSPDFLAEHWFYQTTGNLEARGLMIFDLSTVPAGSVITSATLSLYADSTTANSGNGEPDAPTYGQTDNCILQRITSPWNQLEVTWNNQPATTAGNAVIVPQSTSNAQNYTLDMTSFIQYWEQHPDSNFGMMLSMPNSTPFNNLIFCSSAHPNPALRPALNICYQAPANVCNASFTYTNAGDSVWFYNQSVGGDSVQWKFDDGDSSSLNNPVHAFSQNGIHLTTLTVFDSTGGCSSVTPVNVTGIINDTLCGVVFFDVNHDNLYDDGDYPLTGFQVVIDGNSYYTDNTGFYHIPVGGGGHIISVVVPQFSYQQTSPLAPLNYTIATTNNDYICGLDFGMNGSEGTGIKTLENGKAQLTIFPNPVQSLSFNVGLPVLLQTADVTLSLVDVLGREVSLNRIETHPGAYTIYLSNDIQSGLYTLRYASSNRQLSTKVLLIR